MVELRCKRVGETEEALVLEYGACEVGDWARDTSFQLSALQPDFAASRPRLTFDHQQLEQQLSTATLPLPTPSVFFNQNTSNLNARY